MLGAKKEKMGARIRDSHGVVGQQQFSESGDFTDQD